MKKINISTTCSHTTIPNSFIDNYLNAENPVYVLIYIMFLRFMQSNQTSVTTKTVADNLLILESDVVRALKFWEKKGLMKLDNLDSDEGSISFLPIDITEKQNNEISQNSQESLQGDSPEEFQEDIIDNSQTAKNVIELPFIKETRPSYTSEELEIYRQNSKEVAELFLIAQNVLGKLLTFNDMNVLFSFHDWLRLPMPVIEMMLKYCADNDHRNLRYIEKCAIDWASNNIYTVEDAKNYIDKFNFYYRSILKAFGFTQRNPIKSEIAYMNKWLDDLLMPLEVIVEACDRTVLKTGTQKFSYADRIIVNWHEQGVRTLEGVARETEKFNNENLLKKEEKKALSARAKEKVATIKQNKFANFKQRDWDFKEIEKMEEQFLIDMINNK